MVDEFAIQALSIHQAIDEESQFIQVQGLLHVVARPNPHGCNRVFDRPVRGHQDDGQGGVFPADLPQDVETRDVREAQIYQHEIRGSRVELLEPPSTRLLQANLVAVCPKCLSDPPAQQGLVLDDQNRAHGGQSSAAFRVESLTRSGGNDLTRVISPSRWLPEAI